MSLVIEPSTLASRALCQIERDLNSALIFLNEYELLMPEGKPCLDASYDEIQRKKACVELALSNAYARVYAFRFVFADCAEYALFKSFSEWLFELSHGICLFHSVPDFRAAIQTLLDSILTRSVLDKPIVMTWGLIK